MPMKNGTSPAQSVDSLSGYQKIFEIQKSGISDTK